MPPRITTGSQFNRNVGKMPKCLLPPPQELNVHEIQRPNSNQFHRMNKKNGESPVIHPIHTAATVKMHHETKLATI